MLKVSKFGGTSMRNGKTIEHVINNIITPDSDRKGLVFSAPKGVTNSLLAIAEDYRANGILREHILDGVKEAYEDIAKCFGIESKFLDRYFAELENAMEHRRENKYAYLDSIAPYGEIIQANLVGEILRRNGENVAVYSPSMAGLLTDGNFTKAKIREDSYERMSRTLKPLVNDGKNRGKRIILYGYHGVDENGLLTTLGRGGSDISGAILAHALDADLYENFTDVDGVMTADPNFVQEARAIPYLTYEEARELAISGAAVLHSDTMLPIAMKNITLNVRNTFNLSNNGTYIQATRQHDGREIQGIAHREGLLFADFEKLGMDDQRGVISSIAESFAQHGFSIAQDGTGGDSITLAVYMNGNGADVHGVLEGIKEKGLATKISTNYDMSIVSVVGDQMKNKIKVLSVVNDSLAAKGINTMPVLFTGSSRSVIFGIEQKYAKTTVQILHDNYFSGKS